jgi:hypothetical protein
VYGWGYGSPPSPSIAPAATLAATAALAARAAVVCRRPWPCLFRRGPRPPPRPLVLRLAYPVELGWVDGKASVPVTRSFLWSQWLRSKRMNEWARRGSMRGEHSLPSEGGQNCSFRIPAPWWGHWSHFSGLKLVS